MAGGSDHMTAEGYLARYDAADPVTGIGLLAGWLRSDWREPFAELRACRPVPDTPAFTPLTRYHHVIAPPQRRAAAVAAGAGMLAHLRTLVADRRAGPPGDDILGRLVRTELPAELGFDDERVAINVAGLLLGFVENAAGSMTNIVGRLLGR